MTATATRALRLAAEMLEAVAEDNPDIAGFHFGRGDRYVIVADLRDEIRRGLESLLQGPRQLHALELHHLLTRAVDEAGSEAALARSMGVTRQYLHAVRSGHKPARPSILRHLGMRQVPTGRTLYTPTDG